MHALFTLALLHPSALPSFVGTAAAQEAVSMEAVRFGQVGTTSPGMTFTVNQAASSLQIRVDCGGKTQEHQGPAGVGEKIELRFDVPQGNYTCRGSLAGDFADGTSGEMPLSFTIQQLPPMKIVLAPDSLDLPGRRAGVVLDRTASKVEITALGTHGAELAKGLLPTSAKPGERIDVEWGKPTGEPIKLRIRAFDEHGFWSELVVSVWSYAIPHEDVVFATNQSAVDPAEVYKLEAALVEAKKVVERYEGEVKVRLYVGGHTDTVGDPSMNQKLSEERALSLARWFKAAGFPGDIYFCGYGEGDLAVKTGDNVDEPQNRRAEYLLAGGNPPGKGGGWEPLP
jgi:outer membrane protein OmpA-like peptidoglycan-associated protein